MATEAPLPPRELDPAVYQRSIHPILEARCATLDCHGMDDRPLRLYAETGLRARDDLRGQPLSDEELTANLRAAQAIDPDREPPDSLLVRKPLAAPGGVFHEGGDLWRRADDPELLCLLAWLAGSSDSASAEAACTAAAGQVELPPP
jgi:hypothetical protein